MRVVKGAGADDGCVIGLNAARRVVDEVSGRDAGLPGTGLNDLALLVIEAARGNRDLPCDGAGVAVINAASRDAQDAVASDLAALVIEHCGIDSQRPGACVLDPAVGVGQGVGAERQVLTVAGDAALRIVQRAGGRTQGNCGVACACLDDLTLGIVQVGHVQTDLARA